MKIEKVVEDDSSFQNLQNNSVVLPPKENELENQKQEIGLDDKKDKIDKKEKIEPKKK